MKRIGVAYHGVNGLLYDVLDLQQLVIWHREVIVVEVGPELLFRGGEAFTAAVRVHDGPWEGEQRGIVSSLDLNYPAWGAADLAILLGFVQETASFAGGCGGVGMLLFGRNVLDSQGGLDSCPAVCFGGFGGLQRGEVTRLDAVIEADIGSCGIQRIRIDAIVIVIHVENRL
jgi:hypothetical protein